jgi:hypothetical protein
VFYLIEREDQLNKLFEEEISVESVFIQTISGNDNIHPNINEISLLYVYPINSHKGYIICIDHNESLKISTKLVENYLSKFKNIYVLNKKEYLYYWKDTKNIIDINVSYWLNHNNTLNYKIPRNNCINFYYDKFKDVFRYVNKIIPISIHYEIWEGFVEEYLFEFLENIDIYDEKTFRIYNNIFPNIFKLIEENPLSIDIDKFRECFTVENEYNSIRDNQIFTNYNYLSLTSRPSNIFNNINFTSLKKENNERESFIPENDIFVEFDYQGYHPSIMCDLMNYELPEDEIIHEHLAKIYFPDQEITDELYNESKKITFKQTYGGISKEYLHHPFFNKLQTFISDIWEEFNEIGYISDPLTNKRFYRDNLKKMNPNKLFSYLLQSIETSRNTTILYKILYHLNGKSSKLKMYNFDSFLVDFDKNDGKELIQDIFEIINSTNFSISVKYGDNYKELKLL